MLRNEKKIGVRPAHPLTPAVRDVLARFSHNANITNHAFHQIRNQLQVRVILMQEFGYMPDCRACPTVWTKRGHPQLTLKELREREEVRIQELLTTKGCFAAGDVAVDFHSIRAMINRLKQNGWQIVTKRDTNNSVICYSLKSKSQQRKSRQARKSPIAGGQ